MLPDPGVTCTLVDNDLIDVVADYANLVHFGTTAELFDFKKEVGY